MVWQKLAKTGFFPKKKNVSGSFSFLGENPVFASFCQTSDDSILHTFASECQSNVSGIFLGKNPVFASFFQTAMIAFYILLPVNARRWKNGKKIHFLPVFSRPCWRLFPVLLHVFARPWKTEKKSSFCQFFPDHDDSILHTFASECQTMCECN